MTIDPLLTAVADATFEPNQDGAWLGYSVAGAGDVNGDGYGDVIVGAMKYDAGEADEGAAFVFHGSPVGIANGNPATASATLQSNQSFASFGASVAGAGDVNGDGYADVIVGADAYDAGHRVSKVRLSYSWEAPVGSRTAIRPPRRPRWNRTKPLQRWASPWPAREM